MFFLLLLSKPVLMFSSAHVICVRFSQPIGGRVTELCRPMAARLFCFIKSVDCFCYSRRRRRERELSAVQFWARRAEEAMTCLRDSRVIVNTKGHRADNASINVFLGKSLSSPSSPYLEINTCLWVRDVNNKLKLSCILKLTNRKQILLW